MNEQINTSTSTSLEATKLAGEMAGSRGGIWTHNKAATVFIVAASTHPDSLSKANRWATITVTK